MAEYMPLQGTTHDHRQVLGFGFIAPTAKTSPAPLSLREARKSEFGSF